MIGRGIRLLHVIILLLFLPLFSTAFVGQQQQHRNRGGIVFLPNKKNLHHLLSETVTLPSTLARSVPCTMKKDHDDDERIFPSIPTSFAARNEESASSSSTPLSSPSLLMVSALAIMVSVVTMPLPAMAAAAAGGSSAIPSALWSYGHFLALLGMMGTVVAQKLLVQPGGTMTKDDEGAVGMLNIAYSLALALLLASGYFRVAEVRFLSYYDVDLVLSATYGIHRNLFFTTLATNNYFPKQKKCSLARVHRFTLMR
jgi:hypothetical protein